MADSLLHAAETIRGLLPDVVWLMVLYMVLLDAIQVVKGVQSKGFKILADTSFWIYDVFVHDVTAKHVLPLAASGLIAALLAGQDWHGAAFGVLAGVAVANVADVREELIKELRSLFASPVPAKAAAKSK